MKTYMHRDTGLFVEVETDEDGWLIASVPALPGCVAQGMTVREVGDEISDAIAAVLDTMATTAPKERAAILEGGVSSAAGPFYAQGSIGSTVSVSGRVAGPDLHFSCFTAPVHPRVFRRGAEADDDERIATS